MPISATKSEILSAVAEGTMSPEEASMLFTAMVEPRPLRLKVSPKGAVSIYGMGRFPVTLYRDQWRRVLDYSNEIKEFIETHQNELSQKGNLRQPVTDNEQAT